MIMNYQNSKEYIFAISFEDLQYEAKEKIGRELTDEEIENYTKFLSWCKEKHPEIVIKYEMTKDANKS